MSGKTISSLQMVGTVHRDPQGKTKLLRVLRQEKPAAVSVEISPYARAFRAQKAAAFRALLRDNLRRIHEEEGRPWGEILANGAIRGIFFLLKEPYEWRAAEIYAQGANIALREIDLSPYSEKKLSHVFELVSLENLRTLLRLSFPGLEKEVEAHYDRARFLFSHPPSLWLKSLEEKEREAFMAGEIRRLVHQAKGRKVMHVGGWEHLLEFPRGSSLFGLLKDLRPQRFLLNSLSAPWRGNLFIFNALGDCFGRFTSSQ